MNKRGFTLIEMISSISLIMLVAVVFFGFVGRGAKALSDLNTRKELFEIGQATEDILKRQLETDIQPFYVCLPDQTLAAYEDFAGGEILLLFFKERFYNERTDSYQVQLRAINFRPDTGKILFRNQLSWPIGSIYSIGGYDCATSIQSFRLEKTEEDVMTFYLRIHRKGKDYEKKVTAYFQPLD